MPYYPSPGYDPYGAYGPRGQSGAVAEMQRHHDQLLADAERHRLDRMMREVRDIRHKVDDFDRRVSSPVRVISSTNPYPTYVTEEPEPSVEYSKPSWFSKWWNAFITDPFWEFLERPSIK